MSNVYPHSTRMSVVVKSLADSGKLPADLAPFELGIFDKNWKSLSDAEIPNAKEIMFAVGSPNIGHTGGNSKFVDNLRSHQESMKSQRHSRIIDWYSTTAKQLKPFIGYFGWNGFNECQLDKYECDKTYGYRIAVRGSIVERVFGQHRVESEIAYTTPCCDGCNAPECKEADVKKGYEELVKAINNDSKISRFGFATLVSTCGTEVDKETLDAKIVSLTICDKGDNEALANVLAQYPGKEIKRVKRVGTLSTYEVCILADEDLEDFVMKGGIYPVQACAECAATETEETSELSDEVQCAAEDQTKEWTKVADRKIPTRWSETIFNFPCDKDEAAIDAEIEKTFGKEDEYFFNIIEIEKELLDCIGKIKVKQYGVCMDEGCDDVEVDPGQYVKLPTFLGNAFGDSICEISESNKDCKAGIKWTSYIPAEIADFCGRDPYDFVETNVAEFEMYPVTLTDFAETNCASEGPSFWVAQRGTFKTLSGQQVLKEILLYRKYRGEWHVNPSEALGGYYTKAEGIVYGIDPSKQYYAVHVTGDYSEVTSTSASYGDKLEDVALYFDDLKVRDEFIELLGKSKHLTDTPIRFDI